MLVVCALLNGSVDIALRPVRWCVRELHSTLVTATIVTRFRLRLHNEVFKHCFSVVYKRHREQQKQFPRQRPIIVHTSNCTQPNPLRLLCPREEIVSDLFAAVLFLAPGAYITVFGHFRFVLFARISTLTHTKMTTH